MELVVRKSDLLKELQLFQGIVERKNTIPILANVLMEAEGDEVRFLVTDLEVGLRSRCPASVAKPGSLTLPAKKLFELVRALPETDVRIEEDRNGVKVAADRFDSRMPTLPREDFPTLPKPPGAHQSVLPRAMIREMVAKTRFAITSEDTRYYLNGALFLLEAEHARMAATDGHRLALLSCPRSATDGAPTDGRAILPKKTLDELGRLVLDTEGDVLYERGENHLFFTVGDRVLLSRVNEGQFPSYERVIPRGNERKAIVERERIAGALRRVSLLSSERSRAVKFSVEEGKLQIASSSSDLGEATEEISVEYTGPPVQICFNAQYVADFLNVVGVDSVEISLKDDVSPALFKPIGADGYEYTYVIMPIRI